MARVIYANQKLKNPIHGLIFDMDGVLFDTERDSLPNIIRIGKEMGVDIPLEFVIENMGRNQAEESILMRELLGSGFDTDTFWDRYWTDRNRRYDACGMPVKEGAVKLLEAALEKQCPCVVASSSPCSEVWKSLDRANLRRYFVDVVGGDLFEHSKPAPDIFLAGAKLLGVSPQRCMVIEDSLNGLKAARAAGTLVAFVKDIPSYPESELRRYCDFSFDSAADISEMLS